jgi:hypothetical protein
MALRPDEDGQPEEALLIPPLNFAMVFSFFNVSFSDAESSFFR